jgi:hypothetical protein
VADVITVIPDRVLQRAIVLGLRHYRASPKLLAALFSNLTDAEFTRIVTFLTKSQITIALNYPRAELKPPAIILLLKNESESEAFLGDRMGQSPYYDLPPAEMQVTYPTQPQTLTGLPQRVAGPYPIDSADSNTVYIDEDYLEQYQTFWNNNRSVDFDLYVVDGTGSGQIKAISSFSSTSIDIQGSFDVNLDSTSVVEVRQTTPSDLYGEPARVFTDSSVVTRKGANYQVTYQLDVLGGSQEEVVYLYFILKAILFSQRTFLESQGIQALTISGSDLAPRGEFLPDEVFHRVMNLSFKYVFSILEEEILPTNISIVVTPDVANIEVNARSLTQCPWRGRLPLRMSHLSLRLKRLPVQLER